MVEKMGLPDGLDFGTSSRYGDVLRKLHAQLILCCLLMMFAWLLM